MKAPKLYVVVRSDLVPAQQAVQACHSALAFSYQHRETFERWHEDSCHLAILGVQGEKDLADLVRSAVDRGASHSAFVEPDIGNSLTSVTLEPTFGRELCGRMPLVLKPNELSAYCPSCRPR